MNSNAFLVLKYSEDQPRDSGGRFTVSGASSSEATQAARSTLADAAKHEPLITYRMQQVAKATGAELAGLNFRVKSESSLARKIVSEQQDMHEHDPAKAAANLKDVVRYTMLFPTDKYGEGAQKALDALRAQGYETTRVKNFWEDKPGDKRAGEYRGVNTNVRTPDGYVFELQFHTPQSIDVKENLAHPLYEKQRVAKTAQERREYGKQMKPLWADVPKPPSAAMIKAFLLRALSKVLKM